jgi:hypothetical protein
MSLTFVLCASAAGNQGYDIARKEFEATAAALTVAGAHRV